MHILIDRCRNAYAAWQGSPKDSDENWALCAVFCDSFRLFDDAAPKTIKDYFAKWRAMIEHERNVEFHEGEDPVDLMTQMIDELQAIVGKGGAS
jgi:hypothetical protein